MSVTVSAIGEVELIERMRRRLAKPSSVMVGLGDDAAVVRVPPLRGRGRSHLLIASDMLIEGVHFTRATPARWIGWKALACNISDIAAMGGEPRYAVVSLGVPPSTRVNRVDELYRGLAQCAARYRMAIVGGDTVRAPCLVIDVAIIGSVLAGRAILRSGARGGDVIGVTGRLGGSLRSQHHARFTPRVKEARWLVDHAPIHAMMDLSDGLASDLWQMARASRVTLQIREAALPIARAARTCSHRACGCRRWRGERAAYHALMDGEDFELLFVVSPSAARRLPRALGGVPVTLIGRVTARGAGVTLVHPNGRIRTRIPTGFRHF